MPARIQPFPPDLPLVPTPAETAGSQAVARLLAKREALQARIDRLPPRSHRRIELTERMRMLTLMLMRLEIRRDGRR